MPRKKTLSDEIYNIRRRYKRALQRYERQLEMAKSSQSSSLDIKALKSNIKLARENIERTYARNVSSAKIGSRQRKQDQQEFIAANREKSLQNLAGNQKSTIERRNQMARNILSTSIAGQFYAATRQLWQNANYEDRNDAIIEGFRHAGVHVESLLDVLNYMSEHTSVDYFNIDLNEYLNALRDQYIQQSREGMAVVSGIVK